MNDDPTRFDLDERQRAMLAEMGVRVWAPAAPAAPVASSTPAVPAASAHAALHVTALAGSEAASASTAPASVPFSAPSAVAASGASPSHTASVRPAASAPVRPATHSAPSAEPSTAHPPLPAGLAEMDWAALQTAAAACQACGLCTQRTHSVFGMGSTQAQWLVVGDAPGQAESALGQPFADDAGRLLDNMLKAVGVSREGEGESESEDEGENGARRAYVMHATQCPTPDARNPAPDELSTCAAYVSRKVALLQPRVILVMGRFAMQALLQTTEPLGKMRGQVHRYQGVPVVVTYPPAYLLRNTNDKGKAWADLCLALQVVQDSR